ncbi:PAS domain-containing hybrid sensor histidine kinase/response regulator [Pontibacter chinhatensis]|uniref:histidine kinase n=1 Tax=Pontibacter chinhatensis TaxID=1436961 RepID=A0A1I2N3N4_9BACT|nr:PAS domain-containing hybrid sensor histidine kinase/response regulator [Pontibacter chinhatensis]SFF98525.1 PAS domain S-box-containing protein [Pontibacter chinhatensis]
MTGENGEKRAEFSVLIEESAEDLYENAPCGYLSTLPNGTIVKVNKTLLRWLGYEAEELLHRKKFQDLLPVGGKLYYETHYGPLLQMQGSVSEINFDLKEKQGQRLPVLVNTIQIVGDDGKPLLNRTTVFNITDRKKYEQELLRARKEAEEAAKVKAEFLSTVSHEIRTPLNAIVSIANLLQATDHSKEHKEYFRALKLSADSLFHLINDILDYSKIEAGRVELIERPMSLRELVYSLVYSVSITAEEKGLAMKVELDERLPEQVLGDPVKVGQILTNLLGNAIKFTEEGYVALKLQVQDLTNEEASIHFQVEDTGIGIPPDKLEKVFEEFTQASYDVNLKYGGTGLGLTISQKLLSLYGSKLSVESEEERGTTFFFNLRLKLAPEQNATPDELTNESEDFIRGVKLLLVEDNPVNVLVVSRYLQRWGVEYDVAKDGIEAVEHVMRHDYNLVLMDLQMPHMDGYEATSKIRGLREEKYRQLPIIALSASARYDFKEQMEAAGIDDFISKPFNPMELRAKITFHSLNAAQDALEPAGTEESPGFESSWHLEPPTEPDAPAFTLTTLEEMLEGDEKDLEELVRMTIRNFEIAKLELQNALVSQDLKSYRSSNHRIRMTVELLHAGRLLSTIERGRSLLESNVAAMEEKEEASVAMGEEFNSVISGLKDTLINRWGSVEATNGL